MAEAKIEAKTEREGLQASTLKGDRPVLSQIFNLKRFAATASGARIKVHRKAGLCGGALTQP